MLHNMQLNRSLKGISGLPEFSAKKALSMTRFREGLRPLFSFLKFVSSLNNIAKNICQAGQPCRHQCVYSTTRLLIKVGASRPWSNNSCFAATARFELPERPAADPFSRSAVSASYQ